MLHSAYPSFFTLLGGLRNIPCCCAPGKSSPVTQCPNSRIVLDLQRYLSDLFGHTEDPSEIYPEVHEVFILKVQSLRSSEFILPSVLHVSGLWAGLLSSSVAPYP